tara:strand:- start:3169 stop:3309 length:141 start_codon:yes stop_codon:yes gene_type:complete
MFPILPHQPEIFFYLLLILAGVGVVNLIIRGIIWSIKKIHKAMEKR